MKIKEITFQSRRDFDCIYECEHCGHEVGGQGYDDANFHKNVIPCMLCPECEKTAPDNYIPRSTKYPEGFQI